MSAQSDDQAVAQAQRQPQPSSDFSLSSYREQGSLWAWSEYYHGVKFLSVDWKIHGLSCYQYRPPELDPVITNTTLEESGLQAWLDELSPLNNGTHACGGYQIVQIDTPKHGPIQMKSETFEVITKAFVLPPVELHFQSGRAGGCGMFVQDDGSFSKCRTSNLRTKLMLDQVFVTRKPAIGSHTSSILRYDPSTNTTKGYILTSSENGRGGDILKDLHHQFLACPHPLLIPILLVELRVGCMMIGLDRCNESLSAIEQEIGLSSYFSDNQWPKVGD